MVGKDSTNREAKEGKKVNDISKPEAMKGLMRFNCTGIMSLAFPNIVNRPH